MNSSTTPQRIPKQPNKDWKVVRKKLLIWFIFTVIFFLLPLVFNWLSVFIRGETSNLIDLISDGDLMLIAVAINAAAIGETIEFGSQNTYNSREILAIGICMLTMVLASFLYSELSTNMNSVDQIGETRVLFISLIIFFSALFTSSINVGLSVKS